MKHYLFQLLKFFVIFSIKNTFYGHEEKWEVFDAMHGWSHNRLEIHSKWCSFVGHTSVTHGLRNEESFLSFPRHLGMLGYTKGYDITYRSTRQIPGTFCARFMLRDDCHPLPDQRSFQLIYWDNLNLNTDGLDNDVLLRAKIIKSIQKCLTISGLRAMNNGFCDILIWLFKPRDFTLTPQTWMLQQCVCNRLSLFPFYL